MSNNRFSFLTILAVLTVFITIIVDNLLDLFKEMEENQVVWDSDKIIAFALLLCLILYAFQIIFKIFFIPTSSLSEILNPFWKDEKYEIRDMMKFYIRRKEWFQAHEDEIEDRLQNGSFKIKNVINGHQFNYKGNGIFLKGEKEFDIRLKYMGNMHNLEFFVGFLESKIFVPMGLIETFYSFSEENLNLKLDQIDSLPIGNVSAFDLAEFAELIQLKPRRFLWVQKFNFFEWYSLKNQVIRLGKNQIFSLG